jgi:hypothetical protein
LDTPSVPDYVAASPMTRRRTIEVDHDTTESDPNRLAFLPLSEWDEYNSYDEDIPSRLRYSIEWKVVVNNKVLAKDMEQDVVLAPAAYWRFCLRLR